ncbi:MAG TPA: hypothetical protein VH413_16050 [Verrucomicrobiae bacterium]|jgi:hypothetical protein|nr:hypothetical protein [Verrucomicrobiae bacterium]
MAKPKAITTGAAYIKVNYLLEDWGQFKGDTFNIRVMDEKRLLTPRQKISLLKAAIKKFEQRFPDHEMQKPDYVPGFIAETKGDGVIWFSRA